MKHKAERAFEKPRQTRSLDCPGRHCIGEVEAAEHRYTTLASHPNTPRLRRALVGKPVPQVVADATSDEWLLGRW